MEKIEIGTFYYQLDCGWIGDPKIQMVIDDIGTIGIGVYVAILSWLYLERGVLNRKHYKGIARQIDCDVTLVKKVVEDYELFYFEEDYFSSKRAREDMERRKKMSNGGKNSPKK